MDLEDDAALTPNLVKVQTTYSNCWLCTKGGDVGSVLVLQLQGPLVGTEFVGGLTGVLSLLALTILQSVKALEHSSNSQLMLHKWFQG